MIRYILITTLYSFLFSSFIQAQQTIYKIAYPGNPQDSALLYPLEGNVYQVLFFNGDSPITVTLTITDNCQVTLTYTNGSRETFPLTSFYPEVRVISPRQPEN